MSYQSIGTIDENNSITSSNNRLETTTPSSNGTYLHTSQQKTLCTYISAQGVDDYEDVIIVCNTVTIPFPICQIASIVVITVVASITLIVVFHSLVKNNCLEAPYLYLTTHGRNNIYKYSRDGCLITTKTLKHEHLDATSFRSMAFGPYQGIENALFVASAEGQPQVTVYGNCVQDTNVTSKKKKKIAKGEIINAEASLGERDYLGVLVNRSTSTGAEHAYGIAIGNITGDLYVSFQHTDAVLRFDPSTDYEFFPSPPSSFSQWAPGSYYEGALFQIDTIQSDDNSPNMQGLRGIAAVDDAVWVSDEILNSVFVIDTISGGMLETIAIDAPINLVYDATSGLGSSFIISVYTFIPIPYLYRRPLYIYFFTFCLN